MFRSAFTDSQDHSDLRSTPGSTSSISNWDCAGTDTVGGYIHSQSCNSCGEPIIGVRYQCLNCPSKPSSFNPTARSSRTESMIQCTRSLKYLDQWTFLAHLNPNSLSYIEIPLDPHQAVLLRTYQPSSDPTHAFARCDRHMQRTVGKWYRCAFCAKDLCADCEVPDTHDGTHLFVVFKAPVDMQAFRHFTDPENPAGSPPVLHGNIYYPRHQ